MLEQLFSTPVWTQDFEGPELLHIQTEITDKLVAITAQSAAAPWGDYMSTTWHPSRCTDIEQFQLEGLALGIVKATQGLLTAIQYDGDSLRLGKSWFNWSRKGGFSFDANHPTARIVGCYFHKAQGDEGGLRFSNPHPSQTLGHWPCDYKFQPYHFVDAKEGRLVLWPAYLNWRMEPNCTDSELIYSIFTLI